MVHSTAMYSLTYYTVDCTSVFIMLASVGVINGKLISRFNQLAIEPYLKWKPEFKVQEFMNNKITGERVCVHFTVTCLELCLEYLISKFLKGHSQKPSPPIHSIYISFLYLALYIYIYILFKEL